MAPCQLRPTRVTACAHTANDAPDASAASAAARHWYALADQPNRVPLHSLTLVLCTLRRAQISFPVFVVLSPIILPVLLIRRALYGPIKCGRTCKRKCTIVDAEAADKETDANGKDEAPKTDRA